MQLKPTGIATRFAMAKKKWNKDGYSTGGHAIKNKTRANQKHHEHPLEVELYTPRNLWKTKLRP